MAPGLFFIIFAFQSIICHFYFQIYYSKNPKNTLLQFFVIYFISRFIEIYLSHLLQTNLSFTREGLRTPLTRQVASICSLCAGIIYIVLLGSPTGSITLVSSLGEIPTEAVLHHPIFFGGNTDADTGHQERISGTVAG